MPTATIMPNYRLNHRATFHGQHDKSHNVLLPQLANNDNQMAQPSYWIVSTSQTCLANAVEKTLIGWKKSNVGTPSSPVQGLPRIGGKTAKLLHGTSLHNVRGFSGLTVQDDVSEMIRILDSNEHEMVKIHALKKKLILLQNKIHS